MAGGSLVTKIDKAFTEFTRLGLVQEHAVKIHGAQPENCAPIVNAVKAGTDIFRPIENPKTIVKSLAIGNPADGFYAISTINRTGGYGENPSDEEVIEGIRMLAECEGIFAETAGGTVVAATRRLVETGRIGREESVVLLITGHGLKTKEAIEAHCGAAQTIQPSLREFEALLAARKEQKGETKR
jgi:threonine synthase